ncbi:MAG: 5'-nucleotidase C-terminal domain-containing protein, partial [Deferribacterales bacterium]
NKIILLSHYGYDNVRDLAREVRGIDVIVDGDSHTLLGDFDDLGLTASGSYPTMEASLTGEPVCIVQAWQYSYVVGDLDVAMDKDGRVTSCLGNPVLLVGDILSVSNPTSLFAASAADNQTIIDAINANPNVEIVDEDTSVTAVISEYSDEVQEMKTMVIGRAGEDLLHNRIPGVAYNGVNLPLGSDIAPIVAKGFLELALRADVCIQNAGGVRISIEGDTDISYDTAYTLLPFANTLFEIEMYGSEIKSVLEDAVDFAVAGASSGAFPYSYGLRYDVNAGNEFGNRILNLEVRDRTTGTWSLIDENEMYVVVTNSFTASGQDGYTTFKTVQDQRGLGVDTFLDYAMSFVNYVEMETAAGNDIMKLPASEHPIKSYTPAVD